MIDELVTRFKHRKSHLLIPTVLDFESEHAVPSLMGKSQSVGILCEAIHVVTDKNKAAFGVNVRPVSKTGVVTGNIVTQKS